MKNARTLLKTDIKKIILLENRKEKIILEDIFLSIKAGEIYSFIGKNGSGKTTFLKSLTRLLPLEKFIVKGSVSFKGKDILQMNEKELNAVRRKNIKYIFQDAANSFDPLKKLEYYFKFTGGEEIELKELIEYFKLPSLKKIAKMYVYELSGGMAQRFSLVLALAAKPDILILDEPTSAIDAGSANLLKFKLRDFVLKNSAVLMVTQNLEFAKKSSDKTAIISNNKISNFLDSETVENLNGNTL